MQVLCFDVVDLIFKEVIKTGNVQNIYYASLINKTFYDIFNRHEKDIIIMLLNYFYSKHFTNDYITSIKIRCYHNKCSCKYDQDCLINLIVSNHYERIKIMISSGDYCIFYDKMNDVYALSQKNNMIQQICIIDNHNKTYCSEDMGIKTFLKIYDEKMNKNRKYIMDIDVIIYDKFIELCRKYIYLHGHDYDFIN